MVSSRLSALQLFAYGLPGLPLAILLLPLFITVPTFYADDLGLGFAAVGLILLGARVWDVLAQGPEAEVDAAIAKEREFDPDLWVSEVEDRAGRHMLDQERLL